MAISFVGAAEFDDTAGTPTSAQANMPAGIAVGDLMILAVTENKAPIVITPPGDGWTLLDGPTQETAATQFIYWKPATVSGGGTAPSISSDTGGGWRLDVAAYRGVDTTDPFIDHGARIESGNNQTTTHNAPSITNTDPGAWGVFSGAFRQVVTPSSWTPGAGLTERLDADLGVSNTTNTAQIWADTNGPVGTGSVTYSGTSSSGSAQAMMWAAFLRPATGGGGDTTAPTVPANVDAVADSATQVTVSWDASTDDTAVASYRVQRDGVTVTGGDAVTGLSFVDTTVAPETAYSYTVSAVDAASNRSAESTAANVTTPAAAGGTGAITYVGTTGGWGPGDGTATPTLPVGTAAGDFLVVKLQTGTNGHAPTPTGWTLSNGPVLDPDASDEHSIFTRFADGTATDTPTWSTGKSEEMGWIAVALRGVNPAAPVNQVGSAADTTIQTTAIAMTTTVPNCFVINFVGDDQSAAETISPRFTPDDPSWTDDLDPGLSPGSMSIHDAYRVQAAAGAVPGLTWTQHPEQINGWVVQQIAVAPAPAGTGTLVSRWVGAATDDGATVAVKTAGVTEARLVVATDAGLTTGVVFGSLVTTDTDGVAHLPVSGLAADTAYFYGVELDGVAGGAVGSFRTFPAAGSATSFSFGFGSCTNATDSDAFDRMRARNPLLFVHLGDFAYLNPTGTGTDQFQGMYDTALAASAQGGVYANVPTVYTWSDHDFGGPDSDGGDASKPAAQQVYRQRVPHYPLPDTNAIYHTFAVGRVRFLITDNRSFKSPDTDPDNSSKSILGTVQKQWWKDTITNAAEPVIVWACENPWICDATEPDTWGGFQTERSELAAFAAASGKQLVIISGDMHALAADDGTNSAGGIPVCQAAPFLNSTGTKPGTYSQGTFTGSNARYYGWMDVTDTGDQITLDYSGFDTTDTAQITLSVVVDTSVPAQGTATATFSVTATAAGEHTAQGSTSAPWSITSSAAGGAVHQGTATAPFSVTATASGARPSEGTASAPLSVTASASGSRASEGTAAAAWSVTGSASGEHTAQGAAAPSWSVTASPAGETTPQGTASAPLALAATASGTAPAVGAATGTATAPWSITGSAAGETVHEGTSSAAWSITATATGTAPTVGAATGAASAPWSVTATAAGEHTAQGTSTATWSAGAVASGEAAHEGTATAPWSVDATATGTAPAVGAAQGSAVAAWSVTAAATGRIDRSGTAVATFTVRAVATGGNHEADTEHIGFARLSAPLITVGLSGHEVCTAALFGAEVCTAVLFGQEVGTAEFIANNTATNVPAVAVLSGAETTTATLTGAETATAALASDGTSTAVLADPVGAGALA